MSFSQVFILLSIVILLICVILYSQEMEWSRVNMTHCASSRYEAIIPLYMGYFRVGCFAVISATLLYIITTTVPLEVTVLLKDGSRKLVKSLHFNRCTFFTVWSWILMGIYFLLSAYISFTYHNSNQQILLGSSHQSKTLQDNNTLPQWLISTTWILFEVSLPISYLVSCIVTYVLIPAAVQSRMPTGNFYKWSALTMHNANILFMAVEFMLNDLPISYWHFPFVLVYGMLYVLFSWVFHHYHGYYYYFFLDYSKPYAIFWYLGLFAVVLFFFMLIYVISSILHHYMDSILPSVVLSAMTALCMKIWK